MDENLNLSGIIRLKELFGLLGLLVLLTKCYPSDSKILPLRPLFIFNILSVYNGSGTLENFLLCLFDQVEQFLTIIISITIALRLHFGV